ncbi:hypothetical protein [Limnobacter sp.]|uniref:hypothetical protein n=1 Tax=Limnobacter sp. TaxID=2003368 RepID=UPI00351830D2
MKQLSHHAHAAAFYAEFFGGGPQKRYVLGLNEYANAIAQSTRIDAFVDTDSAGAVHHGKPVIAPNQIPADSMVISTCHRRKPRAALQSLRRLRGVASMDYLAIAQASRGRLPQVTALAQTQLSHAMHQAQFESVNALFSDPESLEIYKRVIDFRLHANLRTMEFFNCPEQGMNIHAMLAPYTHGLVVRADACAVGARALDNKILEPIAAATIEANGNELQVVQGMAWHIQEDQPALAVAVHNHPDHFWQVPHTVLAIRGDYTVHLRHYSEGWADTYMYFIPR